MNKYAKTLVSEYNHSIDFFLPSTRHNFYFYSINSYACRSIISSTNGTALLLNPAQNWSFININTAQRVEEAVFGGNLSTVAFHFSGGAYNIISRGQTFINWHRPPYRIDDTSEIIIQNITVDSIPYFFIVLKGTNETAYWNTEWAKNDSKYLFESDLYVALNDSEEVRKRYVEPELTALLQNVLTKWQSQLQSQDNYSYSYLQKEEDIKQIEDLAKNKYYITNSSDFINGLLDYLGKMALPPTKTLFGFTVNDPDNWLYVTVCGVFPVCIYVIYLFSKSLHKKFSSVDLKFLLGVALTTIISGLSYLLLTVPYDYQFFSIQTAIIITVWIVGFVVVYEVKKTLSMRLIAKKNDCKNTNSKSK